MLGDSSCSHLCDLAKLCPSRLMGMLILICMLFQNTHLSTCMIFLRFLHTSRLSLSLPICFASQASFCQNDRQKHSESLFNLMRTEAFLCRTKIGKNSEERVDKTVRSKAIIRYVSYLPDDLSSYFFPKIMTCTVLMMHTLVFRCFSVFQCISEPDNKTAFLQFAPGTGLPDNFV